MQPDRPGCLAALFPWLFTARPDSRGDSSAATTDLAAGPPPYRLRDDFLSPAERSFFLVLCQAVGEEYRVFPKINLRDLFFVARPNENAGAMNRIAQKHVDFVLCTPDTLHPVLGVELDDSTHRQARRQERDQLVDAAFQAAGLRLVRIPVQPAYDLAVVRSWLDLNSRSLAAPAPSPAPQPAVAPSEGPPSCPRCHTLMVLRTASRGDRKGDPFYGCSNFPRCREVIPVPTAPSGS